MDENDYLQKLARIIQDLLLGRSSPKQCGKLIAELRERKIKDGAATTR